MLFMEFRELIEVIQIRPGTCSESEWGLGKST